MPSKDPRPVTALPNIGPAMARLCRQAGLNDVGALAELGCDDAYARIVAAGHRPHFMAYLALAMGLQGRGIFDCDKAEKATMRARFDRVVSRMPVASDGPSALEAELDRIGVRPAATTPRPFPDD